MGFFGKVYLASLPVFLQDLTQKYLHLPTTETAAAQRCSLFLSTQKKKPKPYCLTTSDKLIFRWFQTRLKSAMHLPVQKVQPTVSISSAHERRTYVCNTRAGEISLFLRCTAGPPCSSMKRRSYPVARINTESNSCASNYEERAHADGGTCPPWACTSCGGAEWASAASHVKDLPLSFSVFTLTPSRGKSRDLESVLWLIFTGHNKQRKRKAELWWERASKICSQLGEVKSV